MTRTQFSDYNTAKRQSLLHIIYFSFLISTLFFLSSCANPYKQSFHPLPVNGNTVLNDCKGQAPPILHGEIPPEKSGSKNSSTDYIMSINSKEQKNGYMLI